MSEEKKENKFLQNLLKNFESKNELIVLKALQDAKTKGKPEVLSALINLLVKNESEVIDKEIKSILFQLKSPKAGETLIQHLKHESTSKHKDVLVSALWQSGIACEEYLFFLTELACAENYMTALEVLTVVETMEGPHSEEEVNDCILAIQEAMETNNDSEKEKLLKSLILVLESLK